MGRRLDPPPLGNWGIVCPYCLEQHDYVLTSDESQIRCESCGKGMKVLIARVRARLSRRLRAAIRQYQIRIVTHSGERELYIEDAYSDNLAMRSGDLVYFVYDDQRPLLICNVTIHTYSRIKIDNFSIFNPFRTPYVYAAGEPERLSAETNSKMNARQTFGVLWYIIFLGFLIFVGVFMVYLFLVKNVVMGIFMIFIVGGLLYLLATHKPSTTQSSQVQQRETEETRKISPSMNTQSIATIEYKHSYSPALQPEVLRSVITPNTSETVRENKKKRGRPSTSMPARDIPEFSNVFCPKCHSIDIELKFAHWASATFKCKTCRNVWKQARRQT